VSPVEVARLALDRIDELDSELHAFIAVDREMTLAMAAESEQRYRSGKPRPLEGVPVSIKDAFDIRGLPTTLGSLHHSADAADDDSGLVRRVRASGAVFTGKTNTAEFGQSATTDNLLGPDTLNPWDPTRTPGGSSGGAAASVAAGLSTLAVGSDGGGSIRIPAAFCGLFGIKPTRGRCPDEGGFRAMTDFVSPGPLTWSAADARPLLEVLAGRRYPRRVLRPLIVGYCAQPEGRPVHPGVRSAVDAAAAHLGQMGHTVIEIDLPLAGWNEVFGPLVLEDEGRERAHLLADPDRITEYERRSLEAAARLDPADVERARRQLPVYRQHISDLFLGVDVLLTPTNAVPAFEIGNRPREIDGQRVDALWGAFPFAVPFNVAGTPAATIACGLVEGLPVGAQLVTPMHTEALLLEVAQSLEESIGFDRTAVLERWHQPTNLAAPSP
jgi:aspartyl-tRNA(Asn)/glutamyl-tRNA(Gln) amidotransferase subunit A